MLEDEVAFLRTDPEMALLMASSRWRKTFIFETVSKFCFATLQRARAKPSLSGRRTSVHSGLQIGMVWFWLHTCCCDRVGVSVNINLRVCDMCEHTPVCVLELTELN